MASPYRAGDCRSAGVANKGSPKSPGYTFAGQGEMGSLSMPVVAAREEWPSGESPKSSGCGFTGQGGTGSLSVPVVAARVGWPTRRVQSHPATHSPARGR